MPCQSIANCVNCLMNYIYMELFSYGKRNLNCLNNVVALAILARLLERFSSNSNDNICSSSQTMLRPFRNPEVILTVLKCVGSLPWPSG